MASASEQHLYFMGYEILRIPINNHGSENLNTKDGKDESCRMPARRDRQIIRQGEVFYAAILRESV